MNKKHCDSYYAISAAEWRQYGTRDHGAFKANYMRLRQKVIVAYLTFSHRASSIQDRHFATLQRIFFLYI